MLPPSFIDNDDLLHVLEDDYKIVIEKLVFIQGSQVSWCYLAETKDSKFFIKIARHTLYLPSVLIPFKLKNHFKYNFTISPIPNKSGEYIKKYAEHDLVVYPYIDGESILKRGADFSAWNDLGVIFSLLHETHFDEMVTNLLKVETFESLWMKGAEQVIDYALTTPDLFGAAEQLASFISTNEQIIQSIMKRTIELGEKAKSIETEMVVCHATPKDANIFLSTKNEILLFAWDAVMLAPRERDTVFFLEPNQSQFFTTYKKDYQMNMTLIAYYKYEWNIQKFNEYGSKIFFSNLDEHAKDLVLRQFVKLFDANSVIMYAMLSEKDII